MVDEVQAISKIKDKSINDVIKTTKFLFLCSRELTSTNLGNPFEYCFEWHGCYQEILEFLGRLPQIIFCLIHFQ